MSKLEIRHLSKNYGKKIALRDLDYEFSAGVYGILGPNGAGKSTLLNILATILKPSGGEVLFDGHNINIMGADYRKSIGVMTQQQTLYPFFTGQQFLEYIAQLKGVEPHQAVEEIAEILVEVELTEQAGKKIGTYSGGMKQRLLFAQALLGDPNILILDEPTTGLDPRQRILLRNLILRISASRIVLLATHVVSDVEAIADEILLVEKGRILQSGTVKELCEVVKGFVVEREVSEDEFKDLSESGMIVNFIRQGKKYWVRQITESRNFDSMVTIVPTLEDVYLYHFHTEEVEGDRL